MRKKKFQIFNKLIGNKKKKENEFRKQYDLINCTKFCQMKINRNFEDANKK